MQAYSDPARASARALLHYLYLRRIGVHDTTRIREAHEAWRLAHLLYRERAHGWVTL